MTYLPPDSSSTVNTTMAFSGTTVVTLYADQKTATGAQAGTILNSPVAGNPNYWWPINVSGTTRYLPCW